MAALGGLRTGLICRQIQEDDLPAVTECLARCFPSRQRSSWAEGIARLGHHRPLEDYPRYGFLLEDAGRVVGVVLSIYMRPDGDGPVRCNMSSWCVEPDYAGYAPRLVFTAFRDRAVTYVNTSPIAKTWRVAEGFGMKRFCEGQILFVPALSRRSTGVRVVECDGPAMAGLTDHERRLLAEHVALGCRAVIGLDADGAVHPFLFQRRRIVRGLLPVRQLVYCRDIAALPRFAGALGRRLLRDGALFFIADAVGPAAGLVGRYYPNSGPKYYRGPNAPRLGDLSYSELVFFEA